MSPELKCIKKKPKGVEQGFSIYWWLKSNLFCLQLKKRYFINLFDYL